MEGSFHVSEDELEEFESLSIKPNGTIITDDSDSVTEYTEEDWNFVILTLAISLNYFIISCIIFDFNKLLLHVVMCKYFCFVEYFS